MYARRFCLWLAVCFCTTSAVAQLCKDFMVLDRFSASTDYLTYERVKNALCQKDVGSQGSASSAGVKAGIPIPVLQDVFDLSFSGNTASSNYSNWSSEFCKSDFRQVQTNLKQRNVSELVSNNARAVIEACLNSEPVYAFFEVDPTGQTFVFNVKVQGRERLNSASVAPTVAVKDCAPKNPFGLNAKADISGQRNQFSCSWDKSKSVQVRLALANQGTRAYFLPAIPTAPLPTPPPPVAVVPVLVPETTLSGDKKSGRCAAFSGEYEYCTPTKPPGWTINYNLPATADLVGDRQCGSWSTCRVSEQSPTRMCMAFTLQGHGEECGRASNTGIHNSRGRISVVWSHPPP